jgi:hypothetical protein
MPFFSFTAPDIALGLLGLLSVWGVFAVCPLVLAKLEWPAPARPERGREQPLQPSVPHGWNGPSRKSGAARSWLLTNL